MRELQPDERLEWLRTVAKSGGLAHISPTLIAVREGRRAINPETLKQMKESVAKIGIVNPITVAVIEREEAGQMVAHIVLAAGLHRLQTAIDLGLPQVPIRIVPPEDAVLVEAIENLDRAELSTVERLEQASKAARLLTERRRRDPNWNWVGGKSVRGEQKLKTTSNPKGAGRATGGDSQVARDLNLTRADVMRGERFARLDEEAKAYLKGSVTLKNSTEVIDAVAKVQSGQQVDFLKRCEQAERIRDVTREQPTVERFDNSDGRFATYAYACADPVEAPTKPVEMEIMSPGGGAKVRGQTLTERAHEILTAFGTPGAEALFEVAVRNLRIEYLVKAAYELLDAEVARRGQK